MLVFPSNCFEAVLEMDIDKSRTVPGSLPQTVQRAGNKQKGNALHHLVVKRN